ncbi:hypothetical protein BB559_006335 [Furculomyces boomerangus]|uniref:Uncharacterized protein n=1 Tax=Furculomyces boomerangus TaxID=61424 RepID=A0A2T9Y3I6_9FUNG|nr:hypothetical protein BB559_006335 [Furculomyces boomerangus]
MNKTKPLPQENPLPPDKFISRDTKSLKEPIITSQIDHATLAPGPEIMSPTELQTHDSGEFLRKAINDSYIKSKHNVPQVDEVQSIRSLRRPRSSRFNVPDKREFRIFPLIEDSRNSEGDMIKLFSKKVDQCSIVFDFSNPNSNLKAKDAKRTTLEELVEYISKYPLPRSETAYRQILNMVGSNIFRNLAPQNGLHGEPFDPEEDEPSMEPACCHWNASIHQHAYAVFKFFMLSDEQLFDNIINQLRNSHRKGLVERENRKEKWTRLYNKVKSENPGVVDGKPVILVDEATEQVDVNAVDQLELIIEHVLSEQVGDENSSRYTSQSPNSMNINPIPTPSEPGGSGAMNSSQSVPFYDSYNEFGMNTQYSLGGHQALVTEPNNMYYESGNSQWQSHGRASENYGYSNPFQKTPDSLNYLWTNTDEQYPQTLPYYQTQQPNVGLPFVQTNNFNPAISIPMPSLPSQMENQSNPLDAQGSYSLEDNGSFLRRFSSLNMGYSQERNKWTQESINKKYPPEKTLELYEFPPEFETADLNQALEKFQHNKSSRGGYRIKWLNDTRALVVFRKPEIIPVVVSELSLNPLVKCRVYQFQESDLQDFNRKIDTEPKAKEPINDHIPLALNIDLEAIQKRYRSDVSVELSNFSHPLETSDLMEILSPYRKNGHIIRIKWFNKNRAIAWFSDPSLASQAVQELQDSMLLKAKPYTLVSADIKYFTQDVKISPLDIIESKNRPFFYNPNGASVARRNTISGVSHGPPGYTRRPRFQSQK